MSSLTALWHQLIELIQARRARFGTHWVQPENWVTRAIEQPVSAPPTMEAPGSAPAVPAAADAPKTRPGQAA